MAGIVEGKVAVVTGAGFIVDWHDSMRYWTGVVFSTSRPGSPAYVGNQAISGVLARRYGCNLEFVTQFGREIFQAVHGQVHRFFN